MEAQILINLIVAGITVLLNGAVTYGVVITHQRWLRADIDRHELDIVRVEDWQAKHMSSCHDRRSPERRDRSTDRGTS